mmetsp:Transcript_7349/g.22573  ORF Transcript_7349/g.22573 Transcript_7349/m.22573 type:complete len:345 (-) Transcript_7349:988-2022(-)
MVGEQQDDEHAIGAERVGALLVVLRGTHRIHYHGLGMRRGHAHPNAEQHNVHQHDRAQQQQGAEHGDLHALQAAHQKHLGDAPRFGQQRAEHQIEAEGEQPRSRNARCRSHVQHPGEHRREKGEAAYQDQRQELGRAGAHHWVPPAVGETSAHTQQQQHGHAHHHRDGDLAALLEPAGLVLPLLPGGHRVDQLGEGVLDGSERQLALGLDLHAHPAVRDVHAGDVEAERREPGVREEQRKRPSHRRRLGRVRTAHGQVVEVGSSGAQLCEGGRRRVVVRGQPQRLKVGRSSNQVVARQSHQWMPRHAVADVGGGHRGEMRVPVTCLQPLREGEQDRTGAVVEIA